MRHRHSQCGDSTGASAPASSFGHGDSILCASGEPTRRRRSAMLPALPRASLSKGRSRRRIVSGHPSDKETKRETRGPRPVSYLLKDKKRKGGEETWGRDPDKMDEQDRAASNGISYSWTSF
ncbi:uncharacterized protein LOC115691621 [Syzygium oleosum]|uniref:uncharacterized protein LOC115691621 n=1 Tax=Syzygium oleosum TaxID=219896 RepID=UPI0024B8B929|nr:uncharacterized protein LOC115691621 [Syzygium oleosum]